MKTKIKPHGDEVTDCMIYKVDPNHTCLAVISMDSTFSKDENHYQQIYFK